MELAHSNRGQFLQVVLKLCDRLPVRIYYRQLKINVITKSLESRLIGCRVRSVGTVPSTPPNLNQNIGFCHF